jgi:hypothetical protein
MGEPVNIIYNNRLVRFCCAGCIEEFNSDPAKYLGYIDEAIQKQQAASYPLDHCIVLTDQNFKPGHDIIVGGRLFRLCCGGCEQEVRTNPATWIAALDKAWADKKN